jgi:hypothetical protein
MKRHLKVLPDSQKRCTNLIVEYARRMNVILAKTFT